MVEQRAKMDRVFINGLIFNTVIGVYEWEKNIQQQLIMDIELGTDTSIAGLSDNLTDALDYAAISARLTEFVEASRFQLLERVAEECAQLILKEFPVSDLVLSVNKPSAVKNAATVGVKIHRQAPLD